MRKIVEDATLHDFDVTINNNNENCTIKCSAGFYLQVVKPCFTSLEKQSVIRHSNISMSVAEIWITNDRKGLEANRKVRFQFLPHIL